MIVIVILTTETGASTREAGSFETSTSRKGYLRGICICSRPSYMIRSILQKAKHCKSAWYVIYISSVFQAALAETLPNSNKQNKNDKIY